MAVANGFGKVVTSGSVFMYDTGDTINSYIGEPTTNYIWHQNPRIDSSYESYMPEAGAGTITQNHPGAIRVYNENGSDISYYINTGVGDWTNQRHAYWVYDQILKRPVVRMYNQNGSWQSKYHNPGIGSLSNIGVSAGTTYVMSWLQYVESLDRAAHVGLYSYSNTNGYNNFWDGLQNGYNTKTHTWQRVSVTFTATDNGQLGNYHGGYMYGHAVGSGELRIADVQLEVKPHATPYSNSLTRSATQGLLPIVGNSTIDLSNVSFDSNAQMVFDGTDDYASVTLPSSLVVYCLEMVWYNNNAIPNNDTVIGGPSTYQTPIEFNGNGQGVHLGAWTGGFTNEAIHIWGPSGATANQVYAAVGYHHVLFNWNGTTYDIWVDGINTPTQYLSGNNPATLITANSIKLGDDVSGYTFNGQIPVTRIYDRALSAAEVKQNYNKYKSRFNLS
jgi:hypothetical protein